MMASIPNMRSTPLPVPTGKGPPVGDQPSGDFAAKLPGAPGQPGVPGAGPKPRPPVAQPPAEPTIPTDGALPDTAEAIKPGEGEGVPETKADAPDGERDPLVLLPFVHAAATPQTPPADATEKTPPTQPATPGLAPVAGQPGRRACGTEGDDGKPGLALPAIPDPEAETQTIEPAVKELLLRKLALAKQSAETQGIAKPETGEAEAATPQNQPAGPASSKAAAPAGTATVVLPATAQAAAPLPATELPQPALAPAIQAAPVRADATGLAEATRTTDLAAERQLDLARESEWLDRLARDIARAGASDTPLRFRLHPQTLGHLQVELQQGDRGTAVRLTVETEAARQLLADAQPRLAAEARAQGVRIAETHVDLSGFGRHAPGEQRRQDDARPSTMIRTAQGPDADAAASTRSSRRARLDRYA